MFGSQKEVVIEANSITRAEFVCELIICSMALWHGTPLISVRDITVYSFDNLEKLPFVGNIIEFAAYGIPMACRIAARASFRSAYVNWIIKY